MSAVDIIKLTNIFISYSHANTELTRKLVYWLQNRGLTVWLDEKDIPKASEWREDIRAGIEGTENFLFLISPESVLSVECAREIDLAIELNKRIIPVLMEDLSTKEEKSAIHPAIRRHNWIFANKEDIEEDAFNEIVETVKTDLEHIRLHTRYTIEARRWHHASDDALLLRDNQLEVAETWISKHIASSPFPTELQANFIKFSRAAQSKFEKQQTRRAGQITSLAVSVALATIIGLIATGYFFNQSLINAREAIKQRDLADSGANATGSLLALSEGEFARAIELAVDATELDNPPVQAWQAIASVVNSPGPRLVTNFHNNGIRAVSYHPEFPLALSADEDHQAYIWNTRTGEIEHLLSGHHDWINATAFSPDGETAYTASSDGFVIAWNVSFGREEFRFQAHTNGVIDLDVSADGQLLLTVGCVDGALFECNASDISLWNSNDGSFLEPVVQNYPDFLRAATINRDSSTVYFAGGAGVVTAWSAADASLEQTHARHARSEDLGAISDIELSPNGLFLVTASGDRTAIVWNLGVERLEYLITAHSDRVRALSFSNDNRFLATVSDDGVVLVHSLDTGTILYQFFGHSDRILSVDFSPSGRYLLTGSSDTTGRIWDLFSSAALRWTQLQGAGARSVALNSDETMLALGDSNGTITIYNITGTEEFVEINTIERAHDGEVFQLEFSPDNTLIYSASFDGTLAAFDIRTGDRVQQFLGHIGRIWAMDLSPDGTLLVSGGDDDFIILWDTIIGSQIEQIRDHAAHVFGLEFSPDGTKLLSGSLDTTIVLRDLTTSSIIHRFEGHSNWVYDVSFNQDGTRALSASADRSIILWDIENLEMLIQANGHDGAVTRVAFTGDGTHAVSGSRQNELIVWDLEQGIDLYRLSGHTDAVWSLIPFASGERFISASFDGSVFEWSLITALPTFRNRAQELLNAISPPALQE